jgi:hypothetical protein
MATVVSMTSTAITAALAAKADLASGILPDSQAPAIAVKKDTWVVDLSDHGGVGDGATYNDTAFVSALAAINPTWGGKIVIRAGSYLVDGATAITLASFGIIIEGAGPAATKIVVASGFSDTAVFKITANDCRIKDLTIAGASTTTTSNPVVDGVHLNSASKFRLDNCNFLNLNGWAFKNVAGALTGQSPSGSMLNHLIIRSCAAGIYWLGNSGSGSTSVLMSDIQIVANGVATGAAANLDGILLEDAWGVETSNVISWMTAGTGAAVHIKGNSITNIFRGVDLEGCGLGPTVLVELGTNGTPYNTKIIGGTIQLGTIGLRVTAATIINLQNLNIINNKTHGLSIESSGNPVYCHDLYFNANGAGASGTNYDVNWSGSSIGFLIDARFETSITSSGTAGVQKSINVSSGQNVRVWNASFAGTGASSSNWFTNFPNLAMETSAGSFHYITRLTLDSGFITTGLASFQPSVSTNVLVSSNVGGVAAFDTFRITADGLMNAGPAAGTAARDTTWGRVGTAEFGSADSDIATMLAGKGFKVKEGTNARMGSVTLVAGTVTVANTSVTANTRIFLTVNSSSANQGFVYVNTRTAGTSFVIKSSNAADTCNVAYLLVEPS